MKHTINAVNLILILVVTLLSGSVYAANKTPYANQVSYIKNYNRATKQIATSGFISDGGLQVLLKFGFKTVIDLRTEEEGAIREKHAVERAGMQYINIPTTGAGINQQQLEAFTQAIDASEKPILVHCASGNRAGAMWASYQISQGVELEKAIKAGRKAGMRKGLEEKVRMANSR